MEQRGLIPHVNTQGICAYSGGRSGSSKRQFRCIPNPTKTWINYFRRSLSSCYNYQLIYLFIYLLIYGCACSMQRFPGQWLNTRHNSDNTGYIFFWFLGPHLEVPRLGVESELQLLTTATATATRDPSHICKLQMAFRSLSQEEQITLLWDRGERGLFLPQVFNK